MFERLGFRAVRAYIQSGNALFLADGPAEDINVHRRGLCRDFGFSCAVFLCTEAELSDILQAMPFTPQEVAAAGPLAPQRSACTRVCSRRLSRRIRRRRHATPGGRRARCACMDAGRFCSARAGIRGSKAAEALAGLDAPMTVCNCKTLARMRAMMAP